MTKATSPSRTLNIILWSVQILLASSLIWAASVKLLQKPEDLAAMWPWTAEHRTLVMLTGLVDLVGGLGLILPGLLLRDHKLTIYAASGIVLLMIIASAFHIARGEANLIGANIAFLLMAIFIVWGRRKTAKD